MSKLETPQSLVSENTQWNSSLKNLLACALLLVSLGVLRWDNPTWIGTNIHPYLVLAFILAGISGVRGSLLSIITIVSVYASWFIELNGVQLFSTSLDGLGFSLGVLLSSVFIGFVTDLIRRENRELSSYVASLKETLSNLEKESLNLTEQINDLTSKIAMESLPLTELIAFSQAMDSEAITEVCDAMVSFVSRRLGSNSCYVFLTNEHELQRIAFVDDDAHVLPVHISLQNIGDFPVISSAFAAKKCISLVELDKNHHHEKLKDGILIATPIIDADENVLGILAIRRLKFMQFLASNRTLIQSVGEYGGSCIAKLNRLNQLKDRNFYNEELGIFNDRYFQIRSDQERIRSIRYNQPLALIQISYTTTQLVGHAKHSLVIKSIIKILNDFRRAEDVLSLGKDSTRFQLLMPMATPNLLQSITTSISEQFKNVMAKANLHLAINIQIDSQWINTSSTADPVEKVA